ncbi:MAG: hypothetical protein K9J16_08365 [Melioribacteraceae bacterium]|nr:hypothetical protein [Melioribacteraceae bacterium]MCF8353162.1 hypothetical protein [Melioribacteraceae bacterium]MCF8393138.1 hypothetical protein [Melioribacteraceae bacterium]MCF8418041.1 hypothetical protein [Melioribacteraceae bacterium]
MKTPKIHLICNAHLDPVWQWQWEEGCAETLSTFRITVDLLNENKDFIFNHNEAVLYKWVKKYEPTLFKEIKELVNNKRWIISGGWFLQPDVNLPQTESIIRQILYGRKFFRENFNAEPEVAYNFDSFGHSGGLPQILNQAGYKFYIHMRPQSEDIELPSNLYRWKGADGSEVLSYRIEVGLYHTEYDNLAERISEATDLALKLNRDVPVFWGIGDHGGGATRDDLKLIKEIQRKEKRVKIIHSSTENLYNAFKSIHKSTPLHHGDIQRIFVGCYTSLSRIKRGALKSFAEVSQSELFSTFDWWLNKTKYENNAMRQIWENHLFNDFHDILPGTCTEPAEKDALNLYGNVIHESRQIKLKAAVNFNRGKKYNHEIPLTVINPNPIKGMLPVECEFMISHRPKWYGKWHVKLFRLDGTEIECQEEWPEAKLPFNHWRRKISFVDEMNGAGAYHYYIKPVEGERSNEDSEFKSFVNFSKDGFINKLFFEDHNLLSGNLFQPIVVKDNGDSWGTGLWKFRNMIGKFQSVDSKVIEEGKVRKIIETILTYSKSKVIIKYILYSSIPLIQVKVRVHWNEADRLKLSIPTKLISDKILCEVPGGIIERPADGEEHVHGRWLIINGKLDGREHSLGIINDGTHGFDYKNGEVRLSALRSPVYCHEHGQKFAESDELNRSDQGVHDFTFLVIPGESDYVQKHISAFADLINNPAATYSHLPIGDKYNESRISISPSNIRMLAFKKSEDNNALIVRLQENANIKTRSTIKIAGLDKVIKLSFKPLEIKTLRIEKNSNHQIVNLINEK